MGAFPPPQIEIVAECIPSALEIYRRLDVSKTVGRGILFDGSGWFESRYSVIGIFPFATWTCQGSLSEWAYPSEVGAVSRRETTHPLGHLQKWLDQLKTPDTRSGLLFPLPLAQGGAAGYISYEFARQIEPHLPLLPNHAGHNVPDLFLMFFDFFLVLDRQDHRLYSIFDPAPQIQMGRLADAACHEGHRKREHLCQALDRTPPPVEPVPVPKIVYEQPPKTYQAHVRTVKEYIRAGDVYQVNLSHGFYMPSAPPAYAIYERLQAINPSPFSVYLNTGALQIACSSPERLVRLRKDHGKNILETRPIAGTRPRGKDPALDQALRCALLTHPKERAEHLMLVDLERNDLGRVCRFGSIHVTSLMHIESYSHVSHLVSHIEGELRDEVSPLAALCAVFPGGTITGVPKIRCMEIISELEPHARGIYSGAIGYFAFNGEMDFNIVIRTWVRSLAGMSAQVGAGIVADSVPEAEYQETLEKAAALIAALK